MFSSDDFKEYRKKLGFSSKADFKNKWLIDKNPPKFKDIL